MKPDVQKVNGSQVYVDSAYSMNKKQVKLLVLLGTLVVSIELAGTGTQASVLLKSHPKKYEVYAFFSSSVLV